jgi:hypothetical protein
MLSPLFFYAYELAQNPEALAGNSKPILWHGNPSKLVFENEFEAAKQRENAVLRRRPMFLALVFGQVGFGHLKR